MAIRQLSEEQVRTMSAAEKDRWWQENVFRGNMPQLTIRSALTGMVLGGVRSLTNLCIGIQTGWTLGVGITSVGGCWLPIPGRFRAAYPLWMEGRHAAGLRLSD